MEPDGIHAAECALAILAALVAYWQHRGKAGAMKRTDAIISFFDPVTAGRSMAAPPGIPDRSWQMPPSTRAFLTRGLPSEEQAVLMDQVDQAEREERVRYAVSSHSAWYEIEYGLVKAGGRRDDLLLPEACTQTTGRRPVLSCPATPATGCGTPAGDIVT